MIVVNSCWSTTSPCVHPQQPAVPTGCYTHEICIREDSLKPGVVCCALDGIGLNPPFQVARLRASQLGSNFLALAIGECTGLGTAICAAKFRFCLVEAALCLSAKLASAEGQGATICARWARKKATWIHMAEMNITLQS